MSQMTRRDFVKLGAVSAGALGATPLGFDLAEAVQVKRDSPDRGREGSALAVSLLRGRVRRSSPTPSDDGKGHTQAPADRGRPDSPVNEGRLCPKGATAMQLAVSDPACRRSRSTARRAATGGRRSPGTTMLDRLAQRIKESRDATFVTTDAKGNTVNRCEGVAFAGGATLQQRGGLPRRQAHAHPGGGAHRTAGPSLTRPHGRQSGGHIR